MSQADIAFEQHLAEVQTTYGLSDAAIANLRQTALDLAKSHTCTIEEAVAKLTREAGS